MPLLKKGAKTLEREALKTGLNIAGDVVQGRNIKQTAKSQLKSTGESLLQKAMDTVATSRPFSNGTIEPVSSLISISTVCNRRCNRGQYCIGSSTRVIISPSLPSTGTIRYLQEDDIKEDMDLAVSLEDSLKQPCLC
jgi:hypothetical protein